MQYPSALGLDDQFKDDDQRKISAEEALRIEFTALCKAISPSDIQGPIFFSADSFDEFDLQLDLPQEDKFAQQVKQATPNATICHMRHYSTQVGAHWHALFAQLDEQGKLKEIVMTDSSRGITANLDRELNPFLSQNADKFRSKQTLGLQQPSGQPICWMYALANLASLATTGKVYTRQQVGFLGKELAERIQEKSKEKIKRASSEVTTEVTSITHSPSFFSSSLSSPTTPLLPSPEVEKERGSSVTEEPIEDQNEQTASNSTAGRNLLLLGIGGIAAGGIALAIPSPVSLPLGIVLLTIGIIMAIAGLFMLIGNCLNCDEPEASPPSPSL
ncbi:hypothetical protein [Legionella nautarum]|nr:hypothetical protein [Legionella nautarum]